MHSHLYYENNSRNFNTWISFHGISGQPLYDRILGEYPAFWTLDIGKCRSFLRPDIRQTGYSVCQQPQLFTVISVLHRHCCGAASFFYAVHAPGEILYAPLLSLEWIQNLALRNFVLSRNFAGISFIEIFLPH
jgi:hypothetical protein